MNKRLLTFLGFLLILAGVYGYFLTYPPNTQTAFAFLPDDTPSPVKPDSKPRSLLPVFDDILNFNKPDIANLPDCPDSLKHIFKTDCRHDLVAKLSKIEFQTAERAFYLTNDKKAFQKNLQIWIDGTLNNCKTDDCLETVYREHIKELKAQKFSLDEIIKTGVFGSRPFFGVYGLDDLNLPIIIALGGLSAFLLLVLFYVVQHARQLKTQLQAATFNPGPASETGKKSTPNFSKEPLKKPWHEVLNVSPDDDQEKVKKAWKALSSLYHPDRAKNEQDRKTREKDIKEINAAWQEAQTINGWA